MERLEKISQHAFFNWPKDKIPFSINWNTSEMWYFSYPGNEQPNRDTFWTKINLT
jgi:hypothetical protein